MIRADRHICIEPHPEYQQWLGERGYRVIGLTAIDFLEWARPADAIFLLDVIEHMEKPEALEVLAHCKRLAKQVVVFTPLGFHPQHYQPGDKDAWGMNGTYWQTHRSGWLPEEFEGWATLVDEHFHGEKGGGFFAIFNA